MAEYFDPTIIDITTPAPEVALAEEPAAVPVESPVDAVPEPQAPR
jgi:hypothetical protein